jgi:hypothetical protein
VEPNDQVVTGLARCRRDPHRAGRRPAAGGPPTLHCSWESALPGPALSRDLCWWLAADFGGPEAMFDALMYIKAGRALQVPVALEVSWPGMRVHT